MPGSASGAGGGAATLGVDSSSQLAPLTVDFHEPGFVAAVNGENAFRAARGFWFQLSDDDRQQAKSPWGPANPQALNRYSYVLNNPVRYVDPTGHCIFVGVDTVACVAFAAAAAEYVLTVIAGAVIIDGIVGMVNDGTTTTIEKKHEGDFPVFLARKADVKYIDYLVKKYGLTKEQRRRLYDEITKKGYSKEEIEEEAQELAEENEKD